MAKLRITRGKDYMGIVRQISVYVNSVKIGGVKHNSSTTFIMLPGELRFMSRWIG